MNTKFHHYAIVKHTVEYKGRPNRKALLAVCGLYQGLFVVYIRAFLCFENVVYIRAFLWPISGVNGIWHKKNRPPIGLL